MKTLIKGKFTITFEIVLPCFAMKFSRMLTGFCIYDLVRLLSLHLIKFALISFDSQVALR